MPRRRASLTRIYHSASEQWIVLRCISFGHSCWGSKQREGAQISSNNSPCKKRVTSNIAASPSLGQATITLDALSFLRRESTYADGVAFVCCLKRH
eukprot:2201966-Amphidinium_carterae.1